MINLFILPSLLHEQGQQHLPTLVSEILPNVKHFFVEDVRTARRFISSLRLGITIEELVFESVKDIKTEVQWYETMHRIQAKGADIALLSDAGMPVVADPGAKLVEWCHRSGIKISPITGPSSILLALVGSGFPGQSFAFHGYLPVNIQDREKHLRLLETESSRFNRTQLFMETPYRNNQMLASVIRTLRPETRFSIATNVTGPDEIIISQSIMEWQKTTIDINKQPTIFSLYAGK